MLRLNEDSLNWSLRHALRYGDADVFPIPFEYNALEYDWDNIKNYLLNQDIDNWLVRPQRVLLSPKGKLGFRVVTQIDPLDFLIFSSIIKDIAPDIEAKRVPIDSNIVFSYRYLHNDNGQLFNPDINYNSFVRECSEILTNNNQYQFIATTDITDFYHKIYLHRLENALNNSTMQSDQVRGIIRLLSGWNGTETFGIPVGSAPTRLLAEITIADIDELLLAKNIKFLRYNDDYRIFAQSYAEAYRHIAFLSEILFSNHGLTLQPKKTNILTIDEFRQLFLTSPEDRALHSLNTRFDNLLNELEITDRYEAIDYEDLEDEQKELVDSLNLAELFQESISNISEIDISLLKFILRRLGQLKDSSILSDIFNNIDTLYPVFPDIIKYIKNLNNLPEESRHVIGNRIFDLIEDSILSELDYHKIWALDLFTSSTEWNTADRFFILLNKVNDMFSRRKLILAMGRAHQNHWFQTRWRSLFDEPHWPRRALIAAASCMPRDARTHWYRSIERRLDHLEHSVLRWARNNPF